MKHNPLNKGQGAKTGKDILNLFKSKEKKSFDLNGNAPKDEIEKQLFSIWSSLLGHENFGVNDDFFQIGGNSIKAVQLVSRVAKQFSINIQLTDVFLRSTIAQLGLLINEGQKPGPQASMQILPSTDKSVYIPLSFNQERLWFIDHLEGSLQYHVPAVLHIKGTLNKDALAQSLKHVIERHQVLRTVILQEDGKPYQSVKEATGWQLFTEDGTRFLQNPQGLEEYITDLIEQPFNLEVDYMMRASLIESGHNDYILVITLHHIASDGWSTSILVREVTEFYSGIIAGQPSKFEPLPLQYADYAVWQQNYLQGDVLEKKLSYWQTRLKGATALQLPTDFPRPPIRSNRGARASFVINNELTEQLRNLGQQAGATLFMTLMTAFKTLLQRYSSQEDICVGSPVANRPQLETEGLIGFFVNTITLRNQVNANTSFYDLLKQVKVSTLEAYEYQDVPFGKVVESVVKERDLSRTPLFQVLFVLQNNTELPDLRLGETVLTVKKHGPQTTQFDISLDLTETSSGLQGFIEYATDLYNDATIVRMVKHFETLLNSIVKDPNEKIGRLGILTEEEQHQLLEEFNNTTQVFPSGRTLISLFETQAAKTPGALAFIFGDEQISYGQLDQKSNQLAHYLRSKGVKEEVLVPICMERGLNMIVGMLAILKAGGAYVPIDLEYPLERISYMVTDSQAKIVITSPESRSKIPTSINADILEIDDDHEEIGRQSTVALNSPIQPNHLAYVIYTSGSTGQPKGVMIEHKNVYEFLCWSMQEFSDSQFDILYATTSICFDLSVFEIFFPLCVGKPVRLLVNGLQIGTYLHIDKSVFVNTVPVVIENLIKEGTPLGNITQLNLAGEPISQFVQQRLDVKTREVRNLYGPTEDTVYSMVFRLKQGEPVLIGKPISNTCIYILNDSQQLQPVGITGEICIAGAGISRGYLHRPELTDSRFVLNPFSKTTGSRMYKTGDLGRVLPTGDIEYLGRLDNQVKIRGYRIELGEIETILQQSSLVSQAAVLAKSDSNGIKHLVGYIVPNNGFDKDAIMMHLKSRMPEYMVPAIWVELQELPLTPNGKIDRKSLPEPRTTEFLNRNFVAPRNEIEDKLSTIWQQLLGKEKVSVYENFFELGGHSLLAMRVVSAIRKQLNVELNIKDLFTDSSIAQLSTRVEQNVRALQTGIRRTEPRPDFIPLSYSQERVWLIDQLEGSEQYHLPAVMGINGNLHIQALGNAFKKVVERHEVLRTSFLERDGQVYQSIRDVWDWQLEVIDLLSPREHPESLEQLIHDLVSRPFDLSKDYPIRASLIRAVDGGYKLVVVMHHIASDGWSVSILVHEILGFYRDLISGNQSTLQPLSIQYSDYAIWQRSPTHGEILNNKLPYWIKKLDGVLPLQLPVDYPRPLVRSKHGAELTFHIEKELSLKILDLGQQQDATLFMTLLAALKVLLYNYSGQEDICVGSPIANRPQTEVEGLIGFFLNTLALRSDVHAGLSFADLLQQIKGTTLEAYGHSEVPFEKVVDAVVKERDLGRTPLFQVMFILENNPVVQKPQISDLDFITEDFSYDTSKFDITFSIAQSATGLQGSVRYATDLYNEATISRMIGHFCVLLNSISEAPDKRIAELEMLTPSERQQLVSGFNDLVVDYPKDKTIVDLFESYAALTPSATAVVFNGVEMSYKNLDEKANQLAHYLRSKGVREDRLVPIFVERSVEMIVGIIGIMKAGGAYVPIETDFPAERINYMLQDCGAEVIVTTMAGSLKLPPAPGVEIVRIDDGSSLISQQPVQKPETSLQPSHLAYVIYTSGSTGKPKGVMIEHRSLVDYVFGLKQQISIDECRSFALVSTIATDLGNTVVYSALVFGGELHLFSKEMVSDVENLHKYFGKHSIDCLKIVPSHWRALSNDDQPLFPNRLLIFGGEALQSNMIADILKSGTTCQVVNHYGPTETTIGKLMHVVNANNRYGSTIPIGKPFSNSQVYVLNKGLSLCPIGVAGQLYITGDGVARGYFNKPDLTKEKFIENPFRKAGMSLMYGTGDLVRYLPDGNIEFIGRVDDQLKIRGYRIELGEIESALQQCALVSEGVVLARADSLGNKRLFGYVVPSGNFDSEAIMAYLKDKLPDYMLPSALIELESLPLTANGKVDRKALPVLDIKEIGKEGFVVPGSEVEKQLASVWQELLGIERVGLQDNFFELGGDSILTIQAASRIKRMGYEVYAKDIFIHQSIGKLSKVIQQRLVEQSNAEQGILTGVSGLLPIQKQYLEDNSSDLNYYNQSILLAINRAISSEELSHAVDRLLESHDALRFKYFKLNRQWQQEYGSAKANVYTEDLSKVEKGDYQILIPEIANKYQQSLDIATGELIRVVYIKMPDSEMKNRLFIVIHHLAIDGVSWRILLGDLEEMFNELKNGLERGSRKKSGSYRQWYHALEQYMKSERLLSQLPFWQNIAKSYQELVTDKGYAQGVTVREISQYSEKLSAEHTRLLLHEVPRVYHTVINDFLLCALSLTLAKWSGRESITIGLEGHGREDIGLSVDTDRTVGWFTTIYPVLLEVSSNSGPDDWIKSVKEQLRQIPDKGIGFGILKHIVKDESLQGKDPWDIKFNYLGQYDNLQKESQWLESANEPTGQGRSLSHNINEKFVINCHVKDSELVVNWNYSTKHFDEKTILTLSTDYISTLIELINHCMTRQQSGEAMFTPSDYGLGSDISYKELDRFLHGKDESDGNSVMSF
ncbi:amino acid adenylation domain-containing protein [Flavitalea antarctica]